MAVYRPPPAHTGQMQMAAMEHRPQAKISERHVWWEGHGEAGGGWRRGGLGNWKGGRRRGERERGRGRIVRWVITASMGSWRKAYGALKDSTKVGLAKVNSDFKVSNGDGGEQNGHDQETLMRFLCSPFLF